jgi:dihydroorotate dehydrogenase (fumarate)
MPDLTTTYVGLKLRSPLVASSSPLCQNIGNILHMEDAGIAAVVLHSLFEEQILIESQALDRHLSAAEESYAESLSYFPDLRRYNIGPDEYVEHIRRTKQAVDIPVIGSLNGVSTGGWIRYARLIEEAGADALELNIYHLPTDPSVDGATVERQYVELVRHIKASVRIPVAVKLGPYFSSIPNMAAKLDEAGADALVLFNRFYQPDFDLESLEVVPNLVLSNSSELLTRLHWVGILYGRIRADMAITGGVHTAQDVLKCMMAGAKVAMMTSALLRQGIDYAARLEEDLIRWMEEHEYESIRQMQGSMSAQRVADPAAFQRANYMRVLSSYELRPRPGVQ